MLHDLLDVSLSVYTTAALGKSTYRHAEWRTRAKRENRENRENRERERDLVEGIEEEVCRSVTRARAAFRPYISLLSSTPHLNFNRVE